MSNPVKSAYKSIQWKHDKYISLYAMLTKYREFFNEVKQYLLLSQCQSAWLKFNLNYIFKIWQLPNGVEITWMDKCFISILNDEITLHCN